MSAVVEKSTCTGCEACVESCPVEAIAMMEEKAAVDGDKCTECGICVDECPVAAISM